MFEDTSPGVPRPTFSFGYNMLTAEHQDRPTFVFGKNFLTNEIPVFSPQVPSNVPTPESQSSATTTHEGELDPMFARKLRKSVCTSDIDNPGSHEYKTYSER